MLWRLAVATVSLLGFLGGATILASQLERDVAAGWSDGTGFGSIDAGPPDGVKPFRFDGLTLPKDIPFTLPEGAMVNPDGSISLPDGAKLPIDGATFNGIDMTLPTDANLQLPDDAVLNGDMLNCPSGCDLDIPGVGEFKIPPGASMQLPPDVLESLAANGYSGGNLPSDLRIPAGESIEIPQMKVGDGDFTAQDGTRLVPPAGSSFGLPPGTVGSGQNIELPAGTEIDQTSALGLLAGIGYVAATQAGYTSTGLPPELPEQPDSTSSYRTETFVQAEGAVKKGSPFVAAGYVRGVTGPLAGQGLAGTTVVIYVNQTESTPGSQIGTAVTDASGNFRVTLTMPSSLPAGDYVLMANSQPRTIDGAVYAGAWG